MFKNKLDIKYKKCHKKANHNDDLEDINWFQSKYRPNTPENKEL
jgi:hypothetical protein